MIDIFANLIDNFALLRTNVLAALEHPTVISGASPAGTVLPVLCAILAVMCTVTFLTHLRHAVGSIPIPTGVPVLPGGLPLLGHGVAALRNYHRLHDWLYDITKQMGEGRTFAFSLPLLPTSMVVTDPVCLEYVLRRKADNFTKGDRFYKNFGQVLGHGIFTSDGEQWYWQRKLATNIFSVRSFKLYIDTVFAEKMVLLAEVVGQAADSGTPVDLHDLMYRTTLDSFGQIGFGVDPGCLRTPDKVPFAAAFDSAQMISNERFWMPAWPLLEALNGSGHTIQRDMATIKSFALDIISRRRQQLAAERASRDQGQAAPSSSHADAVRAQGDRRSADGSVEECKDLLSLFMAASGPDGKPLSTAQLIDTVINFIIAGRDTTAQALAWTFHLLLLHPEVEEKLLAEVRRVLGPQAVGQHTSSKDVDAGAGGACEGVAAFLLRPSYDQLRELRYTRAVFLETLRLYPSVPENAKYAVRDDVLPDGTQVPAGTQIIYSPYVVNRLERVWGPDALTFRPERWLEMDKAPSSYSYLTFNAGPRLCLGQRLAELEGVFMLTGLLTRFKFTPLDPGAPVTYNLSPTLPMKEGLHVLPQRRA